MDPQRGFTLLELLVAIGIVAVLLSILYSTFNAVVRSTEQVEDVAEVSLMARISLSLMTRDLRSAYWRPPQPGIPSGFSLFVGTDEERDGRPSDSLSFTALSHARVIDGNQDPALSHLDYALAAVPDQSTWVLLHREETNLLSLSGVTLEEFELAEKIHGLNLRYFDGEIWSNEWDAVERNALPKAVEIRIIFRDGSGHQRPFTTITDIPLGQTS